MSTISFWPWEVINQAYKLTSDWECKTTRLNDHKGEQLCSSSKKNFAVNQALHYMEVLLYFCCFLTAGMSPQVNGHQTCDGSSACIMHQLQNFSFPYECFVVCGYLEVQILSWSFLLFSFSFFHSPLRCSKVHTICKPLKGGPKRDPGMYII